MDREALAPFRCKTSSSLLSNNILRPETAAAVPLGLLFLSVTATRCFSLALFSRGGGFTARRCTPPAAARQVAPSCPEQLRAARRVRSRGEQSCCGPRWLKWPRAAPSPSSSCHRTRDLLCFLLFHCLSCTARPLCSPLQFLALHPAGCSHSTAGSIVPPAGSAASKHPLQLCVTVRYGNYVNPPACVHCKPEL